MKIFSAACRLSSKCSLTECFSEMVS
jgi:hypothetical protein